MDTVICLAVIEGKVELVNMTQDEIAKIHVSQAWRQSKPDEYNGDIPTNIYRGAQDNYFITDNYPPVYAARMCCQYAIHRKNKVLIVAGTHTDPIDIIEEMPIVDTLRLLLSKNARAQLAANKRRRLK